MANEDKENPSEENEQPAGPESESEGLSAEELANRPYSEEDAWNKSKKPLGQTILLVAAVVGAYLFFQNR